MKNAVLLVLLILITNIFAEKLEQRVEMETLEGGIIQEVVLEDSQNQNRFYYYIGAAVMTLALILFGVYYFVKGKSSRAKVHKKLNLIDPDHKWSKIDNSMIRECYVIFFWLKKDMS